MYYDIFKYKDIVLYLVASKNKLISSSVDASTVKNHILNKAHMNKYIKWLNQYFNNEVKYHSFSLNLNGSSFQKNVHKQLLEIPYGKTTNYKDIANKINKPKSFRAVGNAIGNNPLLIFIPCHRVIRSDGKLGGFSAGINLKKILLKIEKKK